MRGLDVGWQMGESPVICTPARWGFPGGLSPLASSVCPQWTLRKGRGPRARGRDQLEPPPGADFFRSSHLPAWGDLRVCRGHLGFHAWAGPGRELKSLGVGLGTGLGTPALPLPPPPPGCHSVATWLLGHLLTSLLLYLRLTCTVSRPGPRGQSEGWAHRLRPTYLPRALF